MNIGSQNSLVCPPPGRTWVLDESQPVALCTLSSATSAGLACRRATGLEILCLLSVTYCLHVQVPGPSRNVNMPIALTTVKHGPYDESAIVACQSRSKLGRNTVIVNVCLLWMLCTVNTGCVTAAQPRHARVPFGWCRRVYM